MCSNAYATNGVDNFSCILHTLQRPDADKDDMKSKLSHGSDSFPRLPFFLTICYILIVVCVNALVSIVWKKLRSIVLKDNEVFKELKECLLSISRERSFNPDIDQTDEEGCSSLYKAASRGQLMSVKFLVENGADPNKANEDGRRALHVAAEEGHDAIVHFLLDHGADINAQCDQGQTALHAAIQKNQCFSALRLISKGADVNKRDKCGRIPFHMAAAAGNIHIFKNHIDETWDLNEEDNMGLTVLHHAMRNGNSNIVNHLLKKGVAETPYGGDSLIFASASFGNLDLVKLFISRGGDVNEENSMGQNPLHVAASKGYLDITKCLVQERCDMNKEDHEDFTPVRGAVLNGHLDVLDYLITQGAEITKYDGKSVLQLAAIHGHLDILQYFIRMGADVSEPDDSGQTPLHVAAGMGHLDVVKYHIEQGSRIDKQDHRGYAPLHIVAAKGHLEIAKYLIKENYSKNESDNKGFTPLALAARHGHLDTLKYLADREVDETDSLCEATISGHFEIVASHDDLDNVQYLVQQGFDINSCNEKGWTPLEYAIQNNNYEVIDYLLADGAKLNQATEGSPLYIASRLGNLYAVNILISRGISVNADSFRGQIPIHAAAATGRIQVVETLFENGSDWNKTDIDGWTPLHAAVQNSHLEVVRYLMWKGARDVKYRGTTSLCIAAQCGQLDIKKHLNNEVADVNGEDDMGRIPLPSAAMKADIALVHYLLKHGSDVNKGDLDGWTLMHEALQSDISFLEQFLLDNSAMLTKHTSAHHLDIVDSFLSNGSYVNEQNDTGCIPLHAAAANGLLKIVAKLLNHGSDVNKMADSGCTPLHAADHSGRVDVVQYLISHGATKTRYKGMTVLYIAAQHGYTHLVNYFAMTGCDVNDGTHSGKSPLLAANYDGNMDYVDTDGMTPLQAAEGAGREDVKQVLIRFRAEVQDEQHNDTEKTDGMTPLQAAEDVGHEDGQHFFIRFRVKMCNERHDDTEKSFRSDRNCPEVFRCSWMHEASAYDKLPGINGQSCNLMPLNVTKASFSTQNPRRTNPDRLSLHIKTTIRPTRDFCVSKPKTQLHGSDIQATDGLAVIRMTNKKDEVDCKLGIKNPWRVKFTLIGHIKKTSRSVRAFCVSKSKTQLHGGEVPDTDDLTVTSMTKENDAVDPKLGKKNPRRTNPDSSYRHIKTTIRPTPCTRESCVSKPKTQLHGGEVPATDDLRVTSMTNEKDAVDLKLGIKNERRINENCFSILALLHRVILALALFFACCPILVAGNLRLPEPVTLEAGTRGVITFFLERPTSTLQFSLFYTIQFESKRRPFCIDGQYDIDGFKDPAQVSRFTTTVADKDTSACVNMTIDNVDTLDEDRYIFIGVWHSGEDVLYDTQKKEVFVQRPPGRADCFITLSDSEYPYEVHCWAKTGSMPTTLTCYQNERDLVMVHDISDNWQTTRAIFLLPDTTRFSCCSHDITSTVDAATCNDFEWPPGYSGIPSTEKTTRSRSAGEQSNRPTDPTFLTNITSDVGSGAGRSIIPSQWHFLYLLMYLHAFVIMC